MQHEIKKISLIVNELLTLFLRNHGQNIEIKINREANASEMIFEIHEHHFTKEFIDYLKEGLDQQRQHEVEGYYWQLIGEGDNGEELNLIGVMIDEVQIEERSDSLYLRLYRINNQR